MQADNTDPPFGKPSGYQYAILRLKAFQETKLYDFLAAMPVMLWFGVSISNMLLALANDPAQWPAGNWDLRYAVALVARITSILFIGLVLVLLVVRRTPKAKAKGLMPRLSAFFGTYLMVGVVWLEPQPAGLLISSISLALTFGGVCFSIFALAHLGRSFSLMPEARRLVTDGPYAMIRHPLYLGEAVSTVGLMLQYLSLPGIAIVALQLAFQLQRIKNEEAVLGSLFPEYESYRQHTARLVPGLY